MRWLGRGDVPAMSFQTVVFGFLARGKWRCLNGLDDLWVEVLVDELCTVAECVIDFSSGFGR